LACGDIVGEVGFPVCRSMLADGSEEFGCVVVRAYRAICIESLLEAVLLLRMVISCFWCVWLSEDGPGVAIVR
jgi:hypothetical protein